MLDINKALTAPVVDVERVNELMFVIRESLDNILL